MVTVEPIRTAADHKRALKEIERLWNAEPGTDDYDRLDVLATLVDAYERQQTPIGPPHPIDAIRFALEQRGLTRKDLEPYLGSRSRVSEILSGERRLSLEMIRRLHKGLYVPLEALIAETTVAAGDARRARQTIEKLRKSETPKKRRRDSGTRRAVR